MVGVLLEFYYGRFTEMVFKGKVFFILYLYSISSLYLSLFLLSLSLSLYVSFSLSLLSLYLSFSRHISLIVVFSMYGYKLCMFWPINFET